MRKFNDKTGQRFGLLTVMYRIPNKNGKMYYHCKCDCGNEVDVRSDSLTLDRPHRSCGCYQKNNHPATFIDETGHKYGKLTVLRLDISKDSNKAYWICQCECGNITSVRADELRSGRTVTCGFCGTIKINNRPNTTINEIGNKYGKLTVIDEAGSDKNGKKLWLCKCECGNTIAVRGSSLRNGNTNSCGCLNSKGEEIISKILRNCGVNFKTQYIFDDLLSDKGFNYRFDFAILNLNSELLGLIEFDGQQHFIQTGFGLLEDIQHRDSLKNNYCKEHNIPLLRVPYWEFDNIENIISDFIKTLNNNNNK